MVVREAEDPFDFDPSMALVLPRRQINPNHFIGSHSLREEREFFAQGTIHSGNIKGESEWPRKLLR